MIENNINFFFFLHFSALKNYAEESHMAVSMTTVGMTQDKLRLFLVSRLVTVGMIFFIIDVI
jgi:hypothetical protein